MYERFKTNILVRDKMIKNMERDGIRVDYKRLNKTDYILALRKKIIEEANEVAEEEDNSKLIYELADILEVVQSLASALCIKSSEIDKAQKEKREKSGSFKIGYFTNFVEIEENNPVIDYYLKKPEKYPKM